MKTTGWKVVLHVVPYFKMHNKVTMGLKLGEKRTDCGKPVSNEQNIQ